MKPVNSLTVADLEANPIWQYANCDAEETLVSAVTELPVEDLIGKVIGTQVRFANGSHAWALIGNIDPLNPQLNEHFLTLSIERDGKWFDLARYHDHDAASRGPEALSKFLGLRVEDVFPITFDVQKHARGNPAALSGNIAKEPSERLSRSEIIAMAVPKIPR